jgi:Fic family protein
MKPFIPDQLPINNIDWVAHVNRIGKAHAALARYDGMLQGIVNPSLLLTPLTMQEAVLSSRIEGTQATMEEVFEYDAEPNENLAPGKQADIQEIINYRHAVSYSISALEKRPLSLNLIKEIHTILLNSVRGRNKTPGEFRRIQNYIGSPGADIEDASYIPPSPELVIPSLTNWENYIHNTEKDALVQLAIIKGQFEIIHPFLDGNGRIGRILIPLFLYEKKMLSSPMFYLSSYLENNRDAYYDRLKSISQNGDWNGWISFFLNGITEQANENIIKVKAIKDLYDRVKLEIPALTRSQYSINATDALFAIPIITTASFIKHSSIPKDSAVRILNTLRAHKILRDIRVPRGRRSGLFTFEELLRIVQ